MKLKRAGEAREFEVEIVAREGAALRVRIDGEEIAAEIEAAADGAILRIGGRHVRIYGARTRNAIFVAAGPAAWEFVAVEGRAGRARRALAAAEVAAPMPGKVLRILVAEGDAVAAGQPLLVLEAMKMETTLYAEGAAVVKSIRAAAGAMVDHGAVLIEFSPAPADPSARESDPPAA
ncbi:MAG TPA: biotin/lipoyl-containing protein [Candidatus Binataceae bacterium]|nr:biotin/lipoyl-containing protein [Candidatus Binataceae bacterium]